LESHFTINLRFSKQLNPRPSAKVAGECPLIYTLQCIDPPNQVYLSSIYLHDTIIMQQWSNDRVPAIQVVAEKKRKGKLSHQAN